MVLTSDHILDPFAYFQLYRSDFRTTSGKQGFYLRNEASLSAGPKQGQK